MRLAPLAALALGVLVVLSEVPWIGRTTLWLPLMTLGLAVVLLAVQQIRHGG